MNENCFLVSKFKNHCAFEFDGLWTYQGEIVDYIAENGINNLREVVLKVRQLGFTTFVLLLRWSLCHRIPGYRSKILFQDDSAAMERMIEIIHYAQLNYDRKEGRKTYTKMNEHALHLENGSILRVAPVVGERVDSGAGRGGAVNALDGSEIGYWKNGEKVWAAHGPTLAPDGSSFMECTPKRNVWFKSLWERVKAGLFPGYKPRFLGRDEIYMVTEEGRKHMADERIRLTDSNGSDKLFAQEYPENDIDCWLSDGDFFFNADVVERELAAARQNLMGGEKADFPISVGKIDLVNECIHPVTFASESDFQTTDPPKRVAYGDLQDHRYVIGADVGSGSGADDSTASVRDYETKRVVARFSSNIIKPTAYADRLILIGRWYNNALIVAEITGEYGAIVVDRIVERKYPSSRIYTRKTLDKKTKKPVSKYGWDTNKATRPRMLGHLQAIVDEGYAANPFPDFWDQCQSFRDIDEKPQAEEGYKDDFVMADGMSAYVCDTYRWHGAALKAEKQVYLENDIRKFFLDHGVSEEAVAEIGR